MDTSFYEDIQGIRKIALFDIFGIGHPKCVGYLPVPYVTDYTRKTISEITQELDVRGLSHEIRESNSREYLIVWHERFLQALIDQNQSLIGRSTWPKTANEFGPRCFWDQTCGGFPWNDRPQFQKLIDYAYADPKYFPDIRPKAGNSSKEIVTRYWQDREQGFEFPLQWIPFNQLPVQDVIEIICSEWFGRWGTEDNFSQLCPRRTSHFTLWSEIMRATDYSPSRDAEIETALWQIYRQLKIIKPDQTKIWHPEANISPAAESAFSLIGRRPVGMKIGE